MKDQVHTVFFLSPHFVLFLQFYYTLCKSGEIHGKNSLIFRSPHRPLLKDMLNSGHSHLQEQKPLTPFTNMTNGFSTLLVTFISTHNKFKHNLQNMHLSVSQLYKGLLEVSADVGKTNLRDLVLAHKKITRQRQIC